MGGMKPNRSVPAASVIPVLIYPDVREAVAWLGAAFGFVERVRIGENHRAQLRFGDGALIVGDVRGDRRPPRAGEVTHSVTVRVEHVRGHCERARENGARILMEPTDSSTANGSTTRRTLRATSGRSLKRSPTLPPRNGAGNPSADPSCAEPGSSEERADVPNTGGRSGISMCGLSRSRTRSCGTSSRRSRTRCCVRSIRAVRSCRSGAC
jgi:uncharacterized glyoxalase superfamily protein PhnB